MRIAWVAVVALFPLLAVRDAAAGGGPVAVRVDGREVAWAPAPFMAGGHVLVPARDLAEALEARADWDDRRRRMTVSAARYVPGEFKGSVMLELVPGRRAARRNGQEVWLPVAPRMRGGALLVPLRAVAEMLGARVEWDGAARAVAVKHRILYYERAEGYRRRGDLARARELAIAAPVERAPGSATYPNPAEGSMGYAYYFPWGEVHRYYRIEGNLVQFVAARNGVYTLAWQAVLSRDHNAARLPGDDALARYLARLGYTGFAREDGRRPEVVSGPLVFFDYHPAVCVIAYGIVHADGQAERLGGADACALGARLGYVPHVVPVPGEEGGQPPR